MEQIAIETITSTKTLKSSPIKDKEKQVLPMKVNIGFSANEIIAQLKKDKTISERQFLAFKNECLDILADFSYKLLLKSPLQCSLTIYFSCLNPTSMAEDLTAQRKNLKKFVPCLYPKENLTNTAVMML